MYPQYAITLYVILHTFCSSIKNIFKKNNKKREKEIERKRERRCKSDKDSFRNVQPREKCAIKSKGKEKRKCYVIRCAAPGRTTYVAERRTTRMIFLIQRSVKRWREVYVAQIGQRPRVVTYWYLLSRWLRAWVYTETQQQKKRIARLARNAIKGKLHRM